MLTILRQNGSIHHQELLISTVAVSIVDLLAIGIGVLTLAPINFAIVHAIGYHQSVGPIHHLFSVVEAVWLHTCVPFVALVLE